MFFILLKASTMTLSFPWKQKSRKIRSLQVSDDIWIRVWNTNWDLKQKKKNPVKKKQPSCTISTMHVIFHIDSRSHSQSKQPRRWFLQISTDGCNDTKADNICHLHCVAFQRISSFISHGKTIDCVWGKNVSWLLSLQRNASSNMRRRHGNNALALGVLHTPTHPPFVRRRHKPSHLWSKSPKTIKQKQLWQTSDSAGFQKNRAGRNCSSSRPPTAGSAALRQCFHAHWDGGTRADINIYILGSGAADFSRIVGRLIPVASSSVSALSPSISLSLFPSVSRLFLKPRKAPL